jgi:hypothetical protein
MTLFHRHKTLHSCVTEHRYLIRVLIQIGEKPTQRVEWTFNTDVALQIKDLQSVYN